MEDIQVDIKEGIKLHIIPNEIYKTNLIRIVFTNKLDEENVTKAALLPLVLKQGSKNYPTQKIINIRLEELYGADFTASVDKKGDLQVVTFEADCIKDKFIPNNESITKELFELIFDIVLNPLIEDGGFKPNYIDSEKDKLRKIISELIDNKDDYSLNKCIHEMYGNDGFGLYQMGIESKIDSISNSDLYEFYNKYINESKIDIFISGEIDEETITTYVKEKMSILSERYFDAPNEVSTIIAKKVDKPKEIFESLDIVQGKLVLGCQVDSNMENKKYVGMVYNTLLGASASSLLFQNVREKASLAYYAASRLVDVKSALFIRAGIEIKNYNKALDIIKEQLELVTKGEFTKENIDDAKTTLYSFMRSVKENQELALDYYYMQELYNKKDSVDALINKIEAVTKEEIVEFAKSVKINTIYFLKDNG